MVLFITLSTVLTAQTKDDNMPIGKWLQTIQSTSGISFNYDQSVLTDDIIHIPPDVKDPKKIIAFIEKNTLFSFQFVDEKTAIVNTSKKGYAFKPINIKVNFYDATLQVSMPDVALSIQDRNVSLSSNPEGYLTARVYGQGSDIVSIEYIGYNSQKLTLGELQVMDTLVMTPSEQTLADLIVIDQANKKINNYATTVKLSKIPALAGSADKDPLILAQTIPGIAGIGESVANISIRASTNDQNLIQWNDITVYHAGHYVGLLSSINPFMVDEIDVYHDGFNSRFGNRVAGVIDMKSVQSHPSRLKLDLQSNLLTSNLHLAIPVIRNKVSLDLAGRTSYGSKFQNITYKKFFNQSFQIGRISEIINFIEKNNLSGQWSNQSNVGFHDINAHLMITPTKKDLISISYVTATDIVQNQLSFDWTTKVEVDSLKLSNQGYNIKWQHKFRNKLTWTSMHTKSGFHNSYRYHEDATRLLSNNRVMKLNDVNESKYYTALEWKQKDMAIDIGVEHRKIDNTNDRLFVPNDVYNIDSKDRKIATLQSAFLNYLFEASPTFTFEAGTRLTKYSLNNKYYFEPRASVVQKLTDRLNVKLAAGQYTQVITQIEEYNNLQVEDLFWRLADGKTGNELVPFIKNTQNSLTLTYNHKEWKWSLGVYQKKIESITALGLDFDQSVNPWWIATGSGKGIEAQIKKTWMKSSLMLSYIYSDLILDFGNERVFPAPYNNPNQVNLIYSKSMGRFEFSLIGKWKSGRPYSAYKNFKVTTNANGDPEAIFEYDRFFDKTLPSYMRFDFTVIYKLTTKQSWRSLIGISIINLWNKDNIILRSNYVNYNNWPEISPAIFDKRGLGFTPNLFFELSF
jgi:hypothetical protein